jgi:SAM-dependent methyltransferase
MDEPQVSTPPMTEQGRRISVDWRDPTFAVAWAERDTMRDLLDLPRRIAAALVALDRPKPRLIIDVGSGPGAFLAAFLDEFPTVRGVWSDASGVMLDQARAALAGYGDRVEFRLADMTDLDGVGIPSGADAVITSRAAHHLDRVGLATFYRDAAAHLAPGGWLINLDHIGPADGWDTRLRAVRKRFATSRGKAPGHHHTYPLCSIDDHLDGYRAAGVSDVEIAWRAFFTCLFVGRKRQ